jgi:hypothetical protein
VVRQGSPQWVGGALVEQYAHLYLSQSAPAGMIENGPDLFKRDSGKPLDKLRSGSSVLEILKKCSHRDPGTAEHPGAAGTFRVPLDSRTRGPINHAQIVPSPTRR